MHSIEAYFKKYNMREVLGEIEDAMKLKKITKGSNLIDPNDEQKNILFLVDGAAKVYTLTEDGHLQIIGFIYPLEILGELEFIAEKWSYNTVEAVSDCTIIQIDAKAFQKMLIGNDKLYMFLCKALAKKLKDSSDQLVAMKSYSAKMRLYNYLIKLNEYGHNIEFDSIEMASILGVSDRYLRTLLDELEIEEIIKLKRNRRNKDVELIGKNDEYIISI